MAPVLFNPSAEVLAEFGGIMTGRGRPYHMPGYTGPLSIKCMLRGQATWRTPDAAFVVEPGHLLILNHQQHYSLTIEGEQQVETFCPFFAPALVREAMRARRESAGGLLARPLDPDAPIHAFVERLRPPTPAITAALRGLRLAAGGDDAETWLFALLDAVLDEVDRDRATIAQVPAARKATRHQLYRQVYRAIEYAHANVAADLDLSTLARVAAMSSYHFHRTFRAVVGQTPSRYVAELRLRRAHTLLTSSDRSVTEVCAEVGLASMGSFSTRFHRRVGVPPSRARTLSQA